MKYWVIAIVAIALLASAYWAGTNQDSSKPEATAIPEETVFFSHTPTPVVFLPTPIVSTGDVVIGNRPGNRAPDFRLKDTQSNDMSLRDYLGHEEIRIEFFKAGEVIVEGRTLLDPDNVVHRLYGVTSMPYTVNIDSNGIIR